MTRATDDPAQTAPADCVLLARQPVFDRREQVTGFELSLASGVPRATRRPAAGVVTTTFR